MKNLALVPLLLFSFFAAYSQQYQYISIIPGATDTATWQMAGVRAKSGPPHTTVNCEGWSVLYIMDGRDTLINGRLYAQVVKRVYQHTTSIPYPGNCALPIIDTVVATSHDEFAFGLRDSSGTIISSADTTTPVFNFNATVGNNVNYFGIIQTIDTVNIGGTLRKRMITTYDTLIEGIGSLQTGIDPTYWAGWVDGHHLICQTYQHNGTYNYPNTSCGVIYPAFPTGIETQKKGDYALYPNPFSDHININAPQPVMACLYNSTGSMVLTAAVRGNASLYTGNLTAGLYFIILKDKNGKILDTRKLLKQ